MSHFISRLGMRQGLLECIEDERGQKGNARIQCRCDCGNVKTVVKAQFVAGNVLHCGCERKSGRRPKHGASDSPLYNQWLQMKANKRIVKRWEEFAQMLEDVGDANVLVSAKHKKKLIGPSNFVTRPPGKEVIVEIDGDTRSLAGWGEHLGLTRERARQLHRDGLLVSRVRKKRRK